MADPLVRKIAALLNSDAHERQIAAALVLGEIGLRDAVVVDGLIAAAGKGVPPVQRHAVEALGRLQAKKALPTILGLLASRDDGLRAAAIAAAVVFQDDAVGPVKARLGTATDAIERRGLEEILGRVGGKDAFSALLTALDTSDIEAAKTAALAARHRIKDASPRERQGYLAQVMKLLDRKPSERSPGLTAAALKILGYLEDSSSAPVLLAFAKDNRQPEAVRQEALIALRFTTGGATGARAGAVLIDLAETAALPLARTALYTLASIAIPPPLARRLGALALRGEPERAQLAIERLGQMPDAEAGAQLATILAKTTDRARAEAAAKALDARTEAARVLGAALLDVTDDERTQFLTKLLLPHVNQLAAGAAPEKKIGRSLVQAALARGADPGPGAQSLLVLARKIDGTAIATGLRLLAAKLGKAGKPSALVVWRRLGQSADAKPEDGYALASAELAAGRRDEGMTVLRQLLDRGYDVPAALRKDKTTEPERRYQIGFALMERRHPAGEEILQDLASDGGRSKIARMAKAKLKSAGGA